jgi:hypothetical protein
MCVSSNYLYIITDTTKPGNYEFGNLKFQFLPFYVGVSNTETYYKREDVHIRYAKIKKDITKNKYKMNIINKILKSNKEPHIYRLYENSTRDFIFKKEIDLILMIGNRFDKTGPLVNISKGGEGGDTFTNNPRKEEIREKHRLNAIGSKNNMYGLPLEKRPSHISKLSGTHWNKDRVVSDSTRKKLSNKSKGRNNNKSKFTLLFDKDFNFIKEFECCMYIAEHIGSTKKAVSTTARRNSKKEIPYHTTKEFFIIYKEDWENKFKHKEEEIKEFLRTFRKNKNQF